MRGQSHDLQESLQEVFFEIHEYFVVNMYPFSYRFYVGFLLLYILFIVNISSASFRWRSAQDPSELELCRRSCHDSNSTTSCRKHEGNETTTGRCCVNNDVVVG